MKQRVESKPPPEWPTAYAAGRESGLSSDRIDHLLTERVPKVETPEGLGAASMDGIWLGVAVGIVLWAVIAGVVLLV